MNIQKQNGSYYTPVDVATTMVECIKDYLPDCEVLNILEPSCGDGALIKALLMNTKIQKKKLKLTIIDKNEGDLKKAKDFIDINYPNTELVTLPGDYLEFHFNDNNKFDLVLANPPYINKKHLSPEQIDLINRINIENNLNHSMVNNIWTFFLTSAISKLNGGGVFCFLLPSEILQVNYAKELRAFIKNKFNTIEIIFFDQLVFKGIEQDVLILIGRNSDKRHISFFKEEYRDNNKFKNHLSCSYGRPIKDEKWLKYIIRQKDLETIEEMCKKIQPVDNYCSSYAGIVTASNDYFIIDRKTVETYKLGNCVKRILKKSSYCRSRIVYSNDDFIKMRDNNIKCFVLDLNKISSDLIPDNVKKYLDKGIDKKIHLRYKCKIRNNWYQIPSIHSAEAFVFKRADCFHRVLYNPDNILVTDAAYRIKIKEDFNIQSFVFSYYNSLSLLFAEIEGRYYGGGVLELTPNEFKRLPLPYIEANLNQFNYLDSLFKSKKPIEEILEYTDDIILKKCYNITEDQIKILRETRQHLIEYRLKHSHKNKKEHIIAKNAPEIHLAKTTLNPSAGFVALS